MKKKGMKNFDFGYRYGFSMPQKYVFKARKGLDEDIVRNISYMKGEPPWMMEFRLNAYRIFKQKPMPEWGANLSKIDFDDIYYYIRSTDKQVNSWEELPKEIKETYDKIGIPEAEKKFLAGVSAQYECLTGDSLIFGSFGAVPLVDIKPGMFVYALDENSRLIKKQKVKGILHKGRKPVYKITVAGREIRCTNNHPFLVLKYKKTMGKKRGKFSIEWEYCKNISINDYIAIVKDLPDEGKPYKLPHISLEKEYKGKNQAASFIFTSNKFYTMRQKKLSIPSYTSEDFMWLIGLYYGDGYITKVLKNNSREVFSIAIPKSEPLIRKKLTQSLQKSFHYKLYQDKDIYRVRIFSQPIISLIKLIGVTDKAYTKAMPNWIFSLPKAQKLALIGGYIDSDGYLRNSNKNCDVWITSVNKQLLTSFQMLAISCGLHVTGIHQFSSKDVKDKKKMRVGYRLQITGDLSPLVHYSLKVKQGFTHRRYYHTYGSHHKSPITKHISNYLGFAGIKDISYVGRKDVFDVEVEGEHNFIANGIIVHNSEVVYESINKELTKLGVLFCDMDTAVKKYPEIVQKYFGTVIPSHDNKFAALNSAVWSGGSFVYIPKGVHVKLPLQAYFRINAERFGQFERTLIIAEEGSYVHYTEGCTAPVYTTNSLHAAVVEIVVKKNARVRYTTVQNWSKNVYNLVTKRTRVDKNGVMEWVDCNIGSQVTMKYPSCYLMEEGARGEVLSIAYASKDQHQDAGAKMFHFAPNTSSRIVSKSISKDGGRTSYRGLVQVMPKAKNCSIYVSCDALLIDEKSRSDTYPDMKIKEQDVDVQHEATVEKLGEEKLFYLASRGIKKSDAEGLLVNGFIEPVAKEIPFEYAIELNKLINLEMSGSVG